MSDERRLLYAKIRLELSATADPRTYAYLPPPHRAEPVNVGKQGTVYRILKELGFRAQDFLVLS